MKLRFLEIYNGQINETRPTICHLHLYDRQGLNYWLSQARVHCSFCNIATNRVYIMLIAFGHLELEFVVYYVPRVLKFSMSITIVAVYFEYIIFGDPSL